MNRFNGSAPVAPIYELGDTECHTWFERDRQCVELRSKFDDSTIVEFWDEDVSQAVEDGFLNPRDYHGSAYEYAVDCGIIARA